MHFVKFLLNKNTNIPPLQATLLTRDVIWASLGGSSHLNTALLLPKVGLAPQKSFLAHPL